jgi:hypothetical protein
MERKIEREKIFFGLLLLLQLTFIVVELATGLFPNWWVVMLPSLGFFSIVGLLTTISLFIKDPV